jgi:hypothetical protein
MWEFFGRLESFWIVSDFHQNTVPWSDHDMIFLSCLEIAWTTYTALQSTREMLLWHDNINRVREDRLWILYVRKCRYADGLYGSSVSVKVDLSLPQRKLYQNLVINAPETLQVEGLHNYFLTKPLLHWAGDFATSRTPNGPEFSFATVSESKLCLSSRMPLVLMRYLYHSKIAFACFSVCADPYVTKSLVCLSKVFDVLMARQMESAECVRYGGTWAAECPELFSWCQNYHTCAASGYQRCIDELNLDLQRGLMLNPVFSQIIVFSRCTVDIPPPPLLVGSNII